MDLSCSVDGCERKHKARSLCRMHYARWWRDGDPVTTQVNIARSEGLAVINSRKTRCPQGHPYTGENLRITTSGRRVCRACTRAHAAAYRGRRAAS